MTTLNHKRARLTLGLLSISLQHALHSQNLGVAPKNQLTASELVPLVRHAADETARMSEAVLDPSRHVRAMMAEAEADRWLQSECTKLLARRPDYRKADYSVEHGVIGGKTFVPSVRQMYLLRYAPLREDHIDDAVLEDLATRSNYNSLKLSLYYSRHKGRRLPQPFVKSFLSNEIGISTSSIENVIKTMTSIDLVRSLPCELEPKAKAIEINDNFLIVVEHWSTMKMTS